MKLVSAFAAISLAAATIVTIPAIAQEARIHGQIQTLDHSVMTVETQKGPLSILLVPDTKITALSTATLADVTKGKFIGTATRAGGHNGDLVAIEVHIFADSMRGTGEGHRPMGHGNTMTNATIGSVASDVHGRILKLLYKGGEQNVWVPDGVPIVKLDPGNQTDLKPGAHVSLRATRRSDGTITTDRVTVGVGGAIPPL